VFFTSLDNSYLDSPSTAKIRGARRGPNRKANSYFREPKATDFYFSAPFSGRFSGLAGPGLESVAPLRLLDLLDRQPGVGRVHLRRACRLPLLLSLNRRSYCFFVRPAAPP
jgi:hypothetical protein